MPTTVVGKESGRRIVVENTEVFMPTGNSFYDLYIHDDPIGGVAETKFTLLGVHLPIGMTHKVEVNRNNPHGVIWDAAQEQMDVDYTEGSLPLVTTG